MNPKLLAGIVLTLAAVGASLMLLTNKQDNPADISNTVTETVPEESVPVAVSTTIVCTTVLPAVSTKSNS